MAIRAKGLSWQYVALLLVALAVWGIEQWRPGLLRGLRDRPATVDAGVVTAGFEEIRGCRWVAHRQNDGDSFRLRLPDGRVEQFRLYFADCPESAFKSYAGGRNNHQRIREQARDFGVTAEEAVEIGKQAAERVEALLSTVEITIFTEWDDPFGDRRFHAFVEMPGGGWLHEWLVREGLARVHTKGARLPDGTAAAMRKKKLEKLEKEVRR